jgi:nicotinamidase-related amidase
MRLFWIIVSAATVAALLPAVAGADRVYHSEHLRLTPMNGAPLRSGFVENIKAEGPMVYAHEIFVLNGARPVTTYTVARDFFFGDPKCPEADAFTRDIATLTTNVRGNARGDVVVRPAEVAGFEGEHGVRWTVRDASGAIAYQTRCTAVTLD